MDGSEQPGDPTKKIPIGEAMTLKGVVALRGPETLDEFEGTVVRWDQFLSSEELQWSKQPPYADVADRIKAKISELPSDAILVGRGVYVDVTPFIDMQPDSKIPFVAIIGPGGVTAHHFQVLSEPEITKLLPQNFLAVARVEGCRRLEQGNRVKITISGQSVQIKRVD